MTYAEAIQFLQSLQVFGANFGLETPRELAALAGDPQEKLRFIHVAGTNGKGSTCAMLESIYRAAGLRVGLFTSPHLVSFRERIQVNRQLIPESDVARLVDEMRGQSSESRPAGRGTVGEPAKAGTPSPDVNPTFFEFVTVLALKYFAEQKCDLVIWETGLGGRLDATNIVMPLASVITNIALDHQQWLGDTLEQIAAEKAGIIKPGVPVVTAAEQPEVLTVIAETAKRLHAPLTVVAADGNPPLTRFAALCRDAATLPLPGEHQRLNAALALATVEVLQKQTPVTDDQILTALAQVNWPGRLQLIERGQQKFLLDGAHNVAGAEALRAAWPLFCSRGRESAHTCPPNEMRRLTSAATLIFGVLGDKDWRAMCEILAPLASRVLLVPVSSERTASPARLAEVCRAAHPAAEVVCCASLTDALEKTGSRGRSPHPDEFVVIAGSLYLVGEALPLLDPAFAGAGDERKLNEWSAAATR